AHVLGMVALALALTVLAIGEAKADPAARDNWVADDRQPVISKLGDLWTMDWAEKNQAGIIVLKLVKTTDAARVFEEAGRSRDQRHGQRHGGRDQNREGRPVIGKGEREMEIT